MVPTSPGWCSGVVLPRLTPGRKVLSPEAVCSRKPSLSEAASTSRAVDLSGAGVQSRAPLAGPSPAQARHRSRPVPVRRGEPGRRERPPGSPGRLTRRDGDRRRRVRSEPQHRSTDLPSVRRSSMSTSAWPNSSRSYVAPIGGLTIAARHHREQRPPLLAHVARADHRVGAPADAADVDVVEQQPVDLDLGDALAGRRSPTTSSRPWGASSAASR